MEIKKEYEKLMKKYNLPEFSKIENELELSSIEKPFFLIRQIRRRLTEKLIFFAKILDGILYPNSGSLVSMHESKAFSDEEKNRMLDLYKKIMVFERKLAKLDVCPDDKKEAESINLVLNNMGDIKSEIMKIAEKIEFCWKKEDKELKEKIYFG
jgi:hypothetical protein